MAEISSEPNATTLVIIQGAKLSFDVTITQAGKDFTGYAGRAKIMNNFTARTIVQALTVATNTAINGSMTLTVSLTPAETAALSNTTTGERRQSIGVFDLEVHNAGNTDVIRMMQGTVFLSREATTA